MANRKLLIGLGAGLAAVVLYMGVCIKESNGTKTPVLKEARASVSASVTLPAMSVYDLYKESSDGKSPQEYVGRIKTGKTLIFAPVNNGLERTTVNEEEMIKKLGDVMKLRGKIKNPDGSVHYIIQERTGGGKLIREYIEPSNERYDLNPDFKAPVQAPKFHSTIPLIKNPDGSMEAYRLLKQGEKLEDVMKEGPVDRYLPVPGLDPSK